MNVNGAFSSEGSSLVMQLSSAASHLDNDHFQFTHWFVRV